MIKISTREREVQRIILGNIYGNKDLANTVNIYVEGNLVIEDLCEEEVVDIFIELLGKNLVSKVKFEYIKKEKKNEVEETECAKKVDTEETGKEKLSQKEESKEIEGTILPRAENKPIENTKKARLSKGMARKNILEFFMKNEGKAFGPKEVSVKTGVVSSTTLVNIKYLYEVEKVIRKDSSGKYYYLENAEKEAETSKKEQKENEEAKTSKGELIETEVNIPVESETETVEVENNTQPEAYPVTTETQKLPEKVSENNESEVHTKEVLTMEQKLRIIQRLFLDERNEEVIKYLFPKKSSFVVNLAQKKFVGESQKRLTTVISQLNDLEIIKFDEKFNDQGRYFISEKWRIWAYLMLAGKPKTEGEIRTEIGMTVKDFNSAITTALKYEMIIKNDKGKRVTYSVL